MNATETVAAAIQKLEGLTQAASVAAMFLPIQDDKIEYELGTTLYRTIEPQLTILRDAMKSLSNPAYMAEFEEFVESTFRHPLLLARSILGAGELRLTD